MGRLGKVFIAKLCSGVTLLALLAACGSSPQPARPSTSDQPSHSTKPNPFPRLEQRYNATLGVYVLNTGTGQEITYRADERFAYASTFKSLLAGVLLKRDSDADLAKVITYTAADILSYAPVTAKHVDTGMTVHDLIAAAVQYSDNTAANLLLKQVGGPGGLQDALRGIGDDVTHSDRPEPLLGSAVPGDIRDTSTPRALGTDLRQFVLGDLLSAQRKQMLTDLLVGNTTGGPYIRAGVPAGWRVGDKTGNGDYGTRNDIAVVWPPSGKPVIIAIQSRRPAADAQSADNLIKDATSAAVAELH